MYRLNTDFQLFFQQKQYTCTDCDNKYCHKQSLVAHKNAAHGLREFKCIDCSSVFGYESDLKRHFRSKHDGKQFVCSVCGNTFTYRTDLVCHLKKKHSDVNWKCRVFTNTPRLMINKKHLKAIKVFFAFFIFIFRLVCDIIFSSFALWKALAPSAPFAGFPNDEMIPDFLFGLFDSLWTVSKWWDLKNMSFIIRHRYSVIAAVGLSVPNGTIRP